MLAAKLLAASGTASKLYAEDVFSAYTYTGNGSTQTITNGIDLAGKGGLVWIKDRSAAYDNCLIDTARGASQTLFSNNTGASQDYSADHTVYNFSSSGFGIGPNTRVNINADKYISWTFRKAPKFFDVVTYTGNGVNNTNIAHSLGVAPGMVVVKKTGVAGNNWHVWHRSGTQQNSFAAFLNTTDTYGNTAQTIWGSPTSSAPNMNASTFSLGDMGSVNENGAAYIAYLFAHDTSTDGLIQCGSFTTDGSGNATVNLGWEPQYTLCKNSGAGGNWFIEDTSRGMSQTGAQWLYAQASDAEATAGGWNKPTATGFNVYSRGASQTFIYLAIRRPNKPPTTGTQVYNAIARTGDGGGDVKVTGVGFAPDLVSIQARSIVRGANWYDRLRGANFNSTNTTAAETTADAYHIWPNEIGMDGVRIGSNPDVNGSGTTYINHFFKRAPGCFDVVCDTGTGAAHTVSHGLGAVPELMIRKKRSAVDAWYVYAGDATDYLVLNTTAATVDLDTIWNDTAPTSTVFTAGTHDDVNANAAAFVTYLFATKAGISKVGSYTGNGSSQTINCGFTTGARFILIKRTDSAGDWYVWDTTRGIVAGNDPHLSLNTTATEVTTDDSIDPDTSGFIVNQLAATNINVTSATYIFLALA